jgi:hypothetical protein
MRIQVVGGSPDASGSEVSGECKEPARADPDTADSQEIYGLLQWLLIDIFPEYPAKLGPPKEESE